VYHGAHFALGSFRCPADSPLWRSENIMREWPHLVFARVPVEITHADGLPVVASPNCATLYNARQPYRRRALDERGDECEWFAIADGTLRDVLRSVDPGVDDRPQRPLLFDHCLINARHFLAQRCIFRAACHENADDLHVEEAFLELLAGVLRGAYERRQGGARARREPTQRSHRALAHAAQIWLARHFAERLSLSTVAAALGVSSFHLCRVFRACTGSTLHQFNMHLRLRNALTAVIESRSDFTTIALTSGFSSSAHFSDAFRAAFGVAPSTARRRPGLAEFRARF
jgi:AraC-like DNA-binding protein